MAGGVNPVGQTTASEFGGLNVSVSKLNGDRRGTPGVLRRPPAARRGAAPLRSPAGSSPWPAVATAAARSGYPAGFNGLVGMKGTAGRIPRGPRTPIAPLTVVLGCLARSVSDVARFYDVTTGFDMPRSLLAAAHRRMGTRPGTHDLRACGSSSIPPWVTGSCATKWRSGSRRPAEALAADVGLQIVDVPVEIPGFGFEWAMANMASLVNELGDAWPACKDELTTEMAFGLTIAEQQYDLKMAAAVEAQRTDTNEGMAAVFDQVDLIICATNPDVAYPADVSLNMAVGDARSGPRTTAT